MLLLRGINVNPSTRVAMADLRALLSELGYPDATTILQSGNVLLSSSKRPPVAPIEAAITAATGVRSKVVALSVDEVRAVAAANPLLDRSDDLSKLIITFLDDEITPSDIERPSESDLDPEALVITSRAVYQWLPAGVLQTKLKPSWWKQFEPLTTARNVRTVNRILATAPPVE